MNDTEIIERTISFVKATLSDMEGGHDWFHVQRVFQNAIRIAREEKTDVLVVSLGALLHDIADSKFHGGDERIGPKTAADFLTSLHLPARTIAHVKKIVKHISFKNSLDGKRKKFNSMEFRVVQDADRLDAIGAIGIARAFNYGGYRNMPLYDPAIPPDLKMTKAEYKRSGNPTINHFYEKLLLLKDNMNTDTGKRLAAERHQFMLNYLEQFYMEWNPL
jgi:uncharacterized protein